MSNDDLALVTRLYEAFQRGDGEAMAACYTETATFRDPVFRLGPDAPGPGHMWRMLTSQAKDLEVRFSDIREEGGIIRAHWEADYTFSATGKKVFNVIEATIRVEDGLIVDHTDDFDLTKWTRMAFGVLGWCIGWTSFFQNKIRAEAAKNLDKWLSRNS